MNDERKNKVYGERIGLVEDTADPDKMMRARVRVIGLHTDQVQANVLPWAEYKLPIGARLNEGGFTPVKVGDWVWIDFPYDGDPRRPRITGSVHYAPDKQPYLPHESWGGSEKLSHKTTGEEPAPGADSYHGPVTFTQHGVTVVIHADKSVSITHRETGTAIRVSPEGDIVLHSENNLFLSAIEHLKGIIEGNLDIKISGKSSTVAMEGHEIDGGTGDLSGVVTKDCICPFTGSPHSDYSLEVQASKG
jgi:uncharacterized protein involved in type VI secretion and phage assembly